MGYIERTEDNLQIYEATIANGASESEAIQTHGMSPVSIIMPSEWTAAQLRWKASDAVSGTYSFVKDTGGNVQPIVVAADDRITKVGNDAMFMPFLKLVSTDSVGAAVNQAGARVIKVVFRRYLS